MEGRTDDIVSLLIQFNHHRKQTSRDERQLILKRRWLMGLAMSTEEEKQLKASAFQTDRVMPETFLREDDVYCETIRNSFEKGLGVSNVERTPPLVEDIMQLLNSRKDKGRIFSLLNVMTCEGLSRFAEILACDSVRFEKICWKSKKFIQKWVAEFLRNKSNSQFTKLSNQLFQFMKDPNNFIWNCLALPTHVSQSSCAAVEKVLDRLGDLHHLVVCSMDRKLRGIKGYMPQLQSPQPGRERKNLINSVRKHCLKMMSNLCEGDELPEPLVKAMTVASLAFKLKLGYNFVEEFQHFPAEIEALQSALSKAIKLLPFRSKVPSRELKKIKILLKPNADLSNMSLRPAIKRLLTEYLLECNDMESIPENLSKVLDIINRRSHDAPYRFFTKADVEEEVECVLTVSAQTKQIAWDLLSEHAFDREFADAYMDDLEDSDDGEGWDCDKWQVKHRQNNRFHLNDTNDQPEVVGETSSTNSLVVTAISKGDFSSPHNTLNRIDCKVELVDETQINSWDLGGSPSTSPFLKSKFSDSPGYRISSLSPDERLKRCHLADGPRIDSTKSPNSSNISSAAVNLTHDNQETTTNSFLAVQEACDKTSLVAYHFIGYLLNAFAHTEGLDLHKDDVLYLRGFNSVHKIVQDAEVSNEEDVYHLPFMQALKELMPTFSESGKNSVKELML